jgi:hypothetical protein
MVGACFDEKQKHDISVEAKQFSFLVKIQSKPKQFVYNYPVSYLKSKLCPYRKNLILRQVDECFKLIRTFHPTP